jgi:hypothetical protein
MYSTIYNPITGRNVNINSKLGKKILKTYIRTLYGGSDSQVGDTDSQVICPICSEVLNRDDAFQHPKCNDSCHPIHRSCIAKYLETQEKMGFNVKCPLCNLRWDKPYPNANVAIPRKWPQPESSQQGEADSDLVESARPGEVVLKITLSNGAPPFLLSVPQGALIGTIRNDIANNLENTQPQLIRMFNNGKELNVNDNIEQLIGKIINVQITENLTEEQLNEVMARRAAEEARRKAQQAILKVVEAIVHRETSETEARHVARQWRRRKALGSLPETDDMPVAVREAEARAKAAREAEARAIAESGMNLAELVEESRKVDTVVAEENLHPEVLEELRAVGVALPVPESRITLILDRELRRFNWHN